MKRKKERKRGGSKEILASRGISDENLEQLWGWRRPLKKVKGRNKE